MKEFRRQENKDGLNLLEKIIPRVVSSNLTFVESVPVNPLVAPLFERNVNISSYTTQGSSTSNQANIEVMHRRRIVLEELMQLPDHVIEQYTLERSLVTSLENKAIAKSVHAAFLNLA